MAKKNKMDRIVKNMELLINELQKEWDESKEIKHTVILTFDEAGRFRSEMQSYIAYYSELLERDRAMSFKESMEYCRQNYITLRFGRKLIRGYENAKNSGRISVTLPLDKEEYRLYKEMRETLR